MRQLLAVLAAFLVLAGSASASELDGLWQAKHRYGPDIRGTLLITQSGDAWQAEIAGRKAPVTVNGSNVAFTLPGGKEGEYRGAFNQSRAEIVGHWISGQRVENGLSMASPVTLAKSGANQWRGQIIPADDTFTFYLRIESQPDGTTSAFLRNPERNLGWIRYRATGLEREGETIRLLAAADEAGKRAVLVEGRYSKDPEAIAIRFPYGGLLDFTRVAADAPVDFYPRGRPGVRYSYAPPPALDDGWETASLEDVGLSRTHIEAFIQKLIDTPIDAPNAMEDHAILIARNGKLVVEEYFHGENRDKPHDNRSAGKSVASDLFGAAMHAGLPVSTSARVYEVMNGGKLPAGLEPRREVLRVEHLLSMTSGFDCDDNNEESPGYEDRMWEQATHPDFYSWTLALNMVSDPGKDWVYCSANPNLVGGIIARATGRYLPALFDQLIARPLEIKRYYLPLSPQGDFTMTGGSRFLPRDFLKLAQLHLNDGVWKGHRVYSKEWSDLATRTHYDSEAYKFQYGYLWWGVEYPYQGRTIRAYFASGNGGQISMAIPELDLAMAFHAGNYNEAGGRRATREYVPQFILPAVHD